MSSVAMLQLDTSPILQIDPWLFSWCIRKADASDWLILRYLRTPVARGSSCSISKADARLNLTFSMALRFQSSSFLISMINDQLDEVRAGARWFPRYQPLCPSRYVTSSAVPVPWLPFIRAGLAE